MVRVEKMSEQEKIKMYMKHNKMEIIKMHIALEEQLERFSDSKKNDIIIEDANAPSIKQKGSLLIVNNRIYINLDNTKTVEFHDKENVILIDGGHISL